MALKIIGFIIKVLKLAFETFVDKPVKVRPARLPRPVKRLWVIVVVAIGIASVIVILRWFFRPMELPPAATGTTPPLPPEKRKPELSSPTGPELAMQKSVDHQPDDLSQLSGIGQKTAQVLVNAGITTFQKIAAMTPGELAAILKQADIRIVNPSTWPKQAAYAAKGDWPGLKNYLAGLKGGQG